MPTHEMSSVFLFYLGCRIRSGSGGPYLSSLIPPPGRDRDSGRDSGQGAPSGLPSRGPRTGADHRFRAVSSAA
ncbi:hypothetical protein GCM10018952_26000 [Streptosporangium vulgare]